MGPAKAEGQTCEEAPLHIVLKDVWALLPVVHSNDIAARSGSSSTYWGVNSL